jgi:hypothetical protein
MSKPKNMTPEQEDHWREIKRQQRKRYYEKYKEKKARYRRETAARARDELRDCIVANLIGLPLSKCTPDMINEKREQLEIKRLLRQLTVVIKEKCHVE